MIILQVLDVRSIYSVNLDLVYTQNFDIFVSSTSRVAFDSNIQGGFFDWSALKSD